MTGSGLMFMFVMLTVSAKDCGSHVIGSLPPANSFDWQQRSYILVANSSNKQIMLLIAFDNDLDRC